MVQQAGTMTRTLLTSDYLCFIANAKENNVKIPAFAKHDFDKHAGNFGISEKMVKPDMERAFAWAGFYARNTLNSENQKEWEDVR